MAQYIDKDALVAKIDKRQSILDVESPFGQGGMVELELLKNNLDTLEMKEIDLNKEIESYFKGFGRFASVGIDDCIDIAKHFFELGLKAKIMTSKLQQRISLLKMEFWTGLQTFENSEMTLSDAYNQGVDDILEELGLKVQKGEKV